jgi:hypothetical protein
MRKTTTGLVAGHLLACHGRTGLHVRRRWAGAPDRARVVDGSGTYVGRNTVEVEVSTTDAQTKEMP